MRALLVLGMHRSGTSALSRALRHMGLWVGNDDELLPAHAQDNPSGYFEREDIHDAHVRHLNALGLDWDRIAALGTIDTESREARELMSELAAPLRALDRHRPWLLKDPRLSLLLPLWRELVPDHAVVVAVRHPSEIAASLQSTPRGTYPTPFLLLLWQKYMGRLLRDLRGRPAIFVDYHRLLADPHGQLTRLANALAGLGLSGLVAPDAATAAALFDAGLHRRRASTADAESLSRAQRDLHAWLVEAASEPGSILVPAVDLQEPDQALAEFEASFDERLDRGRVQAAGEVLVALQRLEQAMAEQRREDEERIRGFAAELAAQREQTQQLRQLTQQQAQQLAKDNRMLGVALSDLQHARASLAIREDELAALAIELGDKRKHIANLEGSWSWRLSAPLRAGGWLAARLAPAGLEQRLHRAYYRLPFLGPERKRRLILWLHRHLPFLTSRTQSYALFRGTFAIAPERRAGAARQPRMDAERAAERMAALPARPLVSILVPTYDTDPIWLQAAIDSVRAQFYPNWQLCLADDASTRAETLALLKGLSDPRIRVVFRAENGGISAASNSALEVAEGEYVALLDHDDLLAADALLESVCALVDGADVVYSDEDKIDVEGRHGEPHFKPDFSADLLLSQNFVCHLLVARRSLVQAVGGFRLGTEGSQDHDLLLRLSERSNRIVHIPKVLYHWRMHPGSTAADPGIKPRSWQAGLSAVADAVARRGLDASVEFGTFPHTYRIRRAIQGTPLVSIIVPFRDKPELLETCVGSILGRTDYPNFEILCVDNGSTRESTAALLRRLAGDPRVRVVPLDMPFNYSAINNAAARMARGEHLLLLNNDTEVISAEWLRAMLEHSQRPDVGVVGARLLYEDDTVQHAGVIAGLGGVAGHSHLNVPASAPGYFCRMHLIQELSAVTFACAMTRKQVFEQLGGLNDDRLRIAFNDVDYCLRAREHGYRVIYTPYALLYHYESKSRGYEDSPEKQIRFSTEIAYMQERHHAALAAGDPFYNVNFPLNRESFAVDLRYADELP